MAKPADAEGVEVTTGTLYRLVPNWPTHWDYETSRPEPRAFRKDGDIGISMLRADRITPKDIFASKPALSDFAICEVSIADLLQDTEVWVREDPDDEFGAAHVIVMGITKKRVDWLCELARRRIVKVPEPPKPERETDKPRM